MIFIVSLRRTLMLGVIGKFIDPLIARMKRAPETSARSSEH